MAPSRLLANVAANGILAAIYLVAGKLGLMLALVHASATAVWLPTGIALAAFLLLGYRVWPGIFLGAFLVNVTTAGSVATSIGIGVGNTLEGMVGAYLVARFARGCSAFDRAIDTFKFAFLAGLVSTTVSATFGVTSLCLGGYADWANYGSIWWTWWLGDMGGALIMAPVLVLWSKNPRLEWNWTRALEACLLFLFLILVALVVFGGLLPIKNYPIAFLCIPILVWGGFRLGSRETVTATFLLSGIAVWGTLNGFGPFVRQSQNESLLLLQTFMVVIAVMGMALAANVAERRRAEEEIQGSLREKDVLLREIHHRVKNNLQVITSMLNLQARQIKDPKAFERFRESQSRVQSIALIHEKLYQSKDLTKIDFTDYVQKLTTNLFRAYGASPNAVTLHINADNAFVGIDTAIPCGLIIHELMSNSLKHAFPAGAKGEICIDFRSEEDHRINLTVSDNGVGLPKDVDFRNTESLGLQLVVALTDQLGGTVELGRNSGTRFKVSFTEGKRGDDDGQRADLSR